MKNERWEWRPLGDLFDIGAGKTMSAVARDGIDKTPFLRTSNVLWDEIDLSVVDEMAIPPHELPGKLVRPGDLLVCEGGDIGRAAIWNGEVETMSFQNHLHRLRPKADGVEPRFFVYFLQCAFTQLGIFEGAGNKTTIPNLSRNRLADLEVPQPPIGEQRAITQALAWVRSAMKSHDRATAIAQELKRAVTRDIFTRGLRGAPQKETEIGQVPDSWDVVPLGSLGRIGNGSTPKKTLPKYWIGGTYPWLTSAKVYDREIVSADQFVTDVALRECHLPRVEPGAILIAITGQGKTLGHCAVLGIQATINQHIAYVATDTKRADPSFVRGYLETQYDYLRQVGSGGGSTKGALTCAFLRGMPIPFPPLDEQREIVEILDAIDRKIDLHKRKRAVLEDLFKALLHKLMTGEISVADLDLSALGQTVLEGVAA
ncbi:restriction endonuclease subunit S [Bradyrhizobium sp. 170]|uniref:restriction endonuclease subunit S n=1 Tax=Bradyrhizobium sp. 170 TaxID=2782641 RepID=UPI001FFF9E62|nr:restriction endonuclease subunit S [Bradyrhizobium sp. 170]UPK03061.1 restriction endonuclease subunit S [Bradyrhizobium sp. 170]